MMGRFDPIEGEPYGSCGTCGVTLQTSQDAAEHRKETLAASADQRSHSSRGTNPDRAARIQSHVDGVIELAIYDALEELRSTIAHAHASEEEITEAISMYTDFANAWEEDR